MATYWFMVDDTIYAEQQALEGDALMQPADPEVPEGMAFVGWFIEYVDAEGQTQAVQLFANEEPELAHVDPAAPLTQVILNSI